MTKLITIQKKTKRKDSFGIGFHFTLLIIIIILAIGRLTLLGQIADDLVFGFSLGIFKYLFYVFILSAYLCFLFHRQIKINRWFLMHAGIISGFSLLVLSCIFLTIGSIESRGGASLIQTNDFHFSFNYFYRHWINDTFFATASLHHGGFLDFRGHWFSQFQTTSAVFNLLVALLSYGSIATVIAVTTVLLFGCGLWVLIFQNNRTSVRSSQLSSSNPSWSAPFLNRQLFAQLHLKLPMVNAPPRIKLWPLGRSSVQPSKSFISRTPSQPSNAFSSDRQHWITPRISSQRLAPEVVQTQRNQIMNQLQVDPFGRRISSQHLSSLPTSSKLKPIPHSFQPLPTNPDLLIEQQNQKFALLKQLRLAKANPKKVHSNPSEPPRVVQSWTESDHFATDQVIKPVLPAAPQLNQVSTDSDQVIKNEPPISDPNQPSAWKKRNAINQLFKTFHVQAKVINHVIGPTITRFEVEVQAGAKVQSVISLEKDLKLVLATAQLRIVYPVPGKSLIGLEIPNEKATFFTLPAVLTKIKPTRQTNSLLVGLGRKIDGELVIMSLTTTPHLLIAGSTGSGKSVCINVIISCLIYQADPSQVRLLLIDPKHVELNFYEGLPHLLCPVIYDAQQANQALKTIIRMIHHRYSQFKNVRKRNIQEYNSDPRIKTKLPFVVVVIDELADLMAFLGREFEASVQTIAQLARAAGVHLVLSTQRPSTDVITGVIKANIPSRIAFKVSNGVDSRTIIDQVGAEKLVGNGDMLYQTTGMARPARAQGTFIDNETIIKLIEQAKDRYPVCYDARFRQITNAAQFGHN